MSEFRGKTLDAGHLAKGVERELDRGVLTFGTAQARNAR